MNDLKYYYLAGGAPAEKPAKSALVINLTLFYM